MKKKLLMLGGSHFQVPAIRYARGAGYHVITCDYLPRNPGHRLADEYHDVSTTDKEAVLALARERAVDGVIAYASDPAAPTAAYVGNRLGLPSNPYDAVRTLTDKERYRAFLRARGFPTPRARGYSPGDDVAPFDGLAFPLVVKPVDSSGSRGISRIDGPAGFPAALELALGCSRAGRVVIEEYVERRGAQIHGDGFVVDGKLRFFCLGNHVFCDDISPFAPISTMMPSRHPPGVIAGVVSAVQGILDALAFRTGAINIEAMLDRRDRIHVMEIGPRSGGNMVPQLVGHATGMDMVAWAVRAAMGDLDDRSLGENRPPTRPHAYYVIHSAVHGTFAGVDFSPDLDRNLLERVVLKEPGDAVLPYADSNCTVGVMVLRFDDMREMEERVFNMARYVRVALDPCAAAPAAAL